MDTVDRLTKLQQRRGWTISQLAEALRVEASYLGRVLRRKRPVSPRIELALVRVQSTRGRP